MELCLSVSSLHAHVHPPLPPHHILSDPPPSFVYKSYHGNLFFPFSAFRVWASKIHYFSLPFKISFFLFLLFLSCSSASLCFHLPDLLKRSRVLEINLQWYVGQDGFLRCRCGHRLSPHYVVPGTEPGTCKSYLKPRAHHREKFFLKKAPLQWWGFRPKMICNLPLKNIRIIRKRSPY